MVNEVNNKALNIIVIIIILINYILLISIIIKINSNIIREPIDYVIKDIEECYLTIHNLINVQDINSDNVKFKTFIYSYTKPYLIELVQNSTHDCLCCS